MCVAVLKDLVLIPVHTKPKDSGKELDELYDVFLHVKDKWKTDVSSTGETKLHLKYTFIKINISSFNKMKFNTK